MALLNQRGGPVSFNRGDTPGARIPLTDPRSYANLNQYTSAPNGLSPDGLWLGYQSNQLPTWAMDNNQYSKYQGGGNFRFFPSVIGAGVGAANLLGGGLAGSTAPVGNVSAGVGGTGGGTIGGFSAGGGGLLPDTVGVLTGGGALPGSIGIPTTATAGLGDTAGVLSGITGGAGAASGGGFLSKLGDFFGGNLMSGLTGSTSKLGNALTGIGLLGGLLGDRKKNITERTTNEPPAYLQGPLQDAVNAALAQFQGGGQNPYPYLDNAFNRAADLTKTRLDTEFAGSGRNIGASYPARSDELQTLASNFYNPANLYAFDPTQQLLNRLTQLLPGAGGTTTNRYPVFKTGLI